MKIGSIDFRGFRKNEATAEGTLQQSKTRMSALFRQALSDEALIRLSWHQAWRDTPPCGLDHWQGVFVLQIQRNSGPRILSFSRGAPHGSWTHGVGVAPCAPGTPVWGIVPRKANGCGACATPTARQAIWSPARSPRGQRDHAGLHAPATIAMTWERAMDPRPTRALAPATCRWCHRPRRSPRPSPGLPGHRGNTARTAGDPRTPYRRRGSSARP